jgi:hypothetical protein
MLPDRRPRRAEASSSASGAWDMLDAWGAWGARDACWARAALGSGGVETMAGRRDA